MVKRVIPPWITLRRDGGLLVPLPNTPANVAPDLNPTVGSPSIPVQGLEQLSRGGAKAGGVSFITSYSLVPFDQNSVGGAKAGGVSYIDSAFVFRGGLRAGGASTRATPGVVNSLGGARAGGSSSATGILVSRGGGRAGGISLAGDQLLEYTISQSSVYSGYTNLEADYEDMTDRDRTSGMGTNFEAEAFLLATFDSPKTVTAVKLAGGNVTNWGLVADYLNGRELQYTTDGSTWNTLLTISGVNDNNPIELIRFDISPTSCIALRIYTENNYVACTEFQIFGF